MAFTGASPRRSRRVLLAAGGVAATAYLYAVNPGESGRYLPCPILATTGFYCPGCGGLRSAHALMHGNVAESLSFHPLVLPLLAVGLIGGAWWFARGRPPVRITPDGWGFRLALLATVAFWVLRNVPGWDWLSPA
ncbi:MAG: DUF2752 domain-containing protein [Actinomycetales bacterium]|nr:DUF2752 domain-containing protein [Actinomycetales bacterium]